MDTKKIRALLTAVDLGSLSAAAEELGYTQSGLTHMMNSLEDELDLPLITRSKTGVRFTPAGLQLEDDLRSLAELSDKIERGIASIKGNGISTIRIGSYSSVTRTWLPAILAEYRFSRPDTELSLSMQDITRQYDAVRNGDLDCAIVSYQESLMSGLAWTPLRNDELVAVLPGNSDYDNQFFPVEAFAGKEFLMPSAGFDLDIMPVFSTLSSTQLPGFRRTNMDDASIVSMVSHGLGVSIMSRLIMQSMPDNVKVLSLAPASFRKLGIIVKNSDLNDPAIRSFIYTAKNTLKNIYS